MKRVSSPVDQLPPQLQRVFHEERALDRQVLREVKTATEVATLSLFVAARVDPHVARLGQELGIACRKGCAFCCRGLKVELTPPEAIAIAEFLRAKTEPEELTAVGEALQSAANEARGLSTRDRWEARRPCYFLDVATGACSIYEARPLGCRSHTSLDAAACEAEHTGRSDGAAIPRPLPIDAIYGVGRMALHAACEDAALDMRAFELTNGVALAFHEPRAAERWHAGEPVFDGAVIPSDERDHARYGADLRRSAVIPAADLLPQNRGRVANEKKRARRAQRATGRAGRSK